MEAAIPRLRWHFGSDAEGPDRSCPKKSALKARSLRGFRELPTEFAHQNTGEMDGHRPPAVPCAPLVTGPLGFGCAPSPSGLRLGGCTRTGRLRSFGSGERRSPGRIWGGNRRNGNTYPVSRQVFERFQRWNRRSPSPGLRGASRNGVGRAGAVCGKPSNARWTIACGWALECHTADRSAFGCAASETVWRSRALRSAVRRARDAVRAPQNGARAGKTTAAEESVGFRSGLVRTAGLRVGLRNRAAQPTVLRHRPAPAPVFAVATDRCRELPFRGKPHGAARSELADAEVLTINSVAA